MIKKNK